MARLKICMYILLASLAVSTQEIVLKLAGNRFDPFYFTFLRFLIAAVIILFFAAMLTKRLLQHLDRTAFSLLTLNGFLFVVIGMVLFQLAVDDTKAGVVAVLFSCNPIFTLVLTFFVFKEKLSIFSIISILISLAGMLLVVDPTNLTKPVGISLALGSAMLFSIYSIFSRKISLRTGMDTLEVTGFTFLFGSLELYLLMVCSKIPLVQHFLTSHEGFQVFAEIPLFVPLHWNDLPLVLISGIFNTALGFVLYFFIMKETSTTLAATQFFVKPALAPLLSFLFLGEPLKVMLILGVGVILIGSAFTIYGDHLYRKR
ncbi:DMT family transporter [Listeria grayi]|uniref:Membrane protein n=1 Tax=Listeria grayi DSM 20601 TaxID=525367 RepID=D7V0U7_LISGR|nr:DMT family transporter [Listeria grayi]EFI83179.1 putative membrane protein [Listeria grayi DSM 20601]